MSESMASKLDLVFLWHMHQPDYRDHGEAGPVAVSGGVGGEFVLPWVYLHAMKDYTDMAAHLERHPSIRCVVNFVPVLLDQIEDYVDQFSSGNFRDPLLRLLATENLDDISESDRRLILHACFQSNHHTMLKPFPHYLRLHDLFAALLREEASPNYFAGAYFADLLTWYHLAWTGEDARRRMPLITELMSKGESYTLEDRRNLLAVIGQLVGSVIPRYRALAASGRVELSTTPQTHPLAPLLIDFKVARETVPDAPLPFAPSYPGGHHRIVEHIREAQASHLRRFGVQPMGMWPAEGAISEAVVHHIAAAGIKWIASGEGVLHGSLHASGIRCDRPAYSAWELGSAPGLRMFFRDERLSDLIGFDYAKWHGRDAAVHLVGELENILAEVPPGERVVVGIILDGENAWEHYPYNGYFFFDDLYGLLVDHPRIRTRTYGDVVRACERMNGVGIGGGTDVGVRDECGADTPSIRPVGNEPVCSVHTLSRLVAGSWVYGSLSTWIGDAQKNRAWDLLCSAKQTYDRVIAGGWLSQEESARASRQLAICESSDWFWWYGDYNSASAVASFDRLFRGNLARLYRCLKLDAPAQLEHPIGGEGAGGEGGSMRRSTSAALTG